MSSWLRLQGLRFGFGDRSIFEDLELEVPEERPVLVVVGPSGVGKTTLIKLLAGHLKPAAGSIEIAGEPVDKPSADRPVVFQDYGLFPWMTVLQNVAFGLRCAGQARAQRHRRAHDLLTSLRLEGTDHLFPKDLSGGMQQRVALARVLAVEPRSILLDEPFSALDSEIKRALCVEVSRQVAVRRTRLVIVTHDLSDATFLADSMLILRPGQAAIWQVQEMPAHPRHEELFDSELLRENSQALRRLLSTIPEEPVACS